MSFHDKKLEGHRSPITSPKGRLFRAFMQGVNDIAFFPTPVRLEFGSQHDDMKAIGGDMRRAMKRVRLGE